MAIVSMSYAEMNPKSADQITYENTQSGLAASNVQDAIDEVNDNLVEAIKNDTFTINAKSNFIIDVNKSRYINSNTILISFVGHATANISNVDIIGFTSATALNYGKTFLSGKSTDRYNITEIAYSYLNKNGITTNLTSGQYYHCETIVFV